MNKKLFIFFLFFLGLRVLLFDVNISEWGDSYHIVRAAKSLREDFSYPVDEKRLPLFSVLIALNPLPVEMIVWAKVLQILLTAGILFLTYRLARRLFPDLDNFALCTLHFALLFSPVFLYWSLRVVGGVLLTFLVLLAFKIYYSKHRWRLPLLGVVCGLAALTRYEGFLLATAFGLGLLIKEFRGFRNFKKLKPLAVYLLSFVLVVSPWLLRNFLTFGNPLFSTYFSEPSTYTYNLKTVFIFLASLVFLFGFPPVFSFFATGVANFLGKFKGENCPERSRGAVPLFIFIFLELLLILFWPAAVPRLFLPLIPFFIIFAVGGISFVETQHPTSLKLRGTSAASLRTFLVTMFLTVVYVLSQYFLRLHFLVLSKSGLALISGLGFLSATAWLIFDFKKAKKIFIALFLVSEAIVSFVVINNHRLIYSDALRAAQFAATLDGVTGYSDETGVVEYYLGEKGRKLPDDFKEHGQQWR